MATRASHLFSADDKREIERAIADAESQTSAEIVVAVASQSGRYDRAEDLVGLAFGVASLLLAAAIWPQKTDPNSWDMSVRFGIAAGEVILLFIVATIAGAAIATWFPPLARAFLTRKHMLDEVKRSGSAAFERLRVRRTADARGVLIYVSLRERMAWVVGDDAIDAEMKPDEWASIRDAIVTGFKRRSPKLGLVDGILKAGSLLASHFPRETSDTDELPNTLHVLD